MTNEEALSILHCPDTVGGLYSEKYGEALGMAMEALKKEPCDDCISRQAAIEAINKYGSVWMEYTEVMSTDEIAERALKASKQSMIKILHDMPSVTPQPKTGHWIDRFPAKECKCSVCDFLICISNGSYIDMIGQMKYCPNCGAKMVEPKAESEGKG